MKTAIEWLEMEIVKLEKDFAIPGKIYELCEQAKELNLKKIVDHLDHLSFKKITVDQFNSLQYQPFIQDKDGDIWVIDTSEFIKLVKGT